MITNDCNPFNEMLIPRYIDKMTHGMAWQGLLSGGFFKDAQGALVSPAYAPKGFCPWEHEETGRKCPPHGSLACLTSDLFLWGVASICFPLSV